MKLHIYAKFNVAILLFILSYSYNVSLAQNNYLLIWDKNASSTASAENLLTIHKIIYDFQNQKIKTTYWEEDDFKGKALGVGYRLSKTILLDFQIDVLTHLFQHEVFGHGYRFREFGYRANSYNIRPFFPYAKFGGFANPGIVLNERKFGIHESIAAFSGGMEGAAVFAKTLKDRWIIRQEINYRESLIYLTTFNDDFLYIWSNKIFNREDNNDVTNYLRLVNDSYGSRSNAFNKLTLNDLAIQSSINLINTYYLFAAYTYLKIYLLEAEENFTFPMFYLGETKWLPSVRFGLTPFGGEFMLENYFVKNRDFLELSLRYGNNQLDDFWGIGAKWRKEMNELLTLQSKIDIWNQPAMILGGVELFETTVGFGGRIAGEVNYQLGKDIPLGLYAQLGYKTTGFIEGENLDKGLIMRLGLLIKQ